MGLAKYREDNTEIMLERVEQMTSRDDQYIGYSLLNYATERSVNEPMNKPVSSYAQLQNERRKKNV